MTEKIINILEKRTERTGKVKSNFWKNIRKSFPVENPEDYYPIGTPEEIKEGLEKFEEILNEITSFIYEWENTTGVDNKTTVVESFLKRWYREEQ